jgi:hypothetical protein
MTVQYQAIFRDTTGARQATVTDFLSLAYTKRTCLGGSWSMVLDDDHPLMSTLQDKWLVDVRRCNPEYSLDWYTDFYGVARDEDYQMPRQLVEYTVGGIAQLNVLGWRHVLWYAGTADRSEFTGKKGENILKTLVRYNATSDATTGNGRIRDGAIANFSIVVEAENDPVQGNTLSSHGCAWDNLLETLYVVSLVGGGDYDLEYDADSHQWTFRWYLGQRGEDRRSTVRFTLNFDNMRRPQYRARRLGEKTVAIVGGKGEGSEREVTVRTGPNYSSANDIETFVHATHVDTEAGRQTVGDEKLEGLKAYEAFTFEPEQVAASAYGVHYCVGGATGDLVKGIFRDVEGDFKITGVTVAVEKREGQDVESIGLEIEAV